MTSKEKEKVKVKKKKKKREREREREKNYFWGCSGMQLTLRFPKEMMQVEGFAESLPVGKFALKKKKTQITSSTDGKCTVKF